MAAYRRKRNRKIVHSSPVCLPTLKVYNVYLSIFAMCSMRENLRHVYVCLCRNVRVCMSLSASLKFMWHFVPFFSHAFIVKFSLCARNNLHQTKLTTQTHKHTTNKHTIAIEPIIQSKSEKQWQFARNRFVNMKIPFFFPSLSVV